MMATVTNVHVNQRQRPVRSLPPSKLLTGPTLELNGDSKKEADEMFYLDLFGNSPDASGFTKNRGIGTILNDD